MARNLEELKVVLADSNAIEQDHFNIAGDVCELWETSQDSNILECIIRAFDKKRHFKSSSIIVDALVRDAGIFPYLTPQEMNSRDQIAYEAHTTESGEGDVVLHAQQLKAFLLLLSGTNVALTAPASFGKSLLIDTLLATGQYNNVVIIVPTIALIDETRRRLSAFRHTHKIITFADQAPGGRNIFILTAERVVERETFPKLDLFVIDEFYKLATSFDAERSVSLNLALQRLLAISSQFYMLGPQVDNIPDELKLAYKCEHLNTAYRTVATNVIRIPGGDDKLAKLIALVETLTDQTIVFCASPNKSREIAEALANTTDNTNSESLKNAIAWIEEHYHAEWHFTKALRKGIGIHHGRIPRSLAQFLIRKFNKGDIRYLICTTTLIEGINTTAKNMVIYDHKIDNRAIDRFTYNNIAGRAGRMFKHTVGNVFVFQDPPVDTLPGVDIPVLTQSESAPLELLIQIDEKTLSLRSQERIKSVLEQGVLDIAVIRRNKGISPVTQINIANEIIGQLQTQPQLVRWAGIPGKEERNWICSVIWRHFGGLKLGSASMRSAAQLSTYIWFLQETPSLRKLIQNMIPYTEEGKNADEAVTRILDFIRLWANFHFPRLVRCINSIQFSTCLKLNVEPGDYEPFASRIENLYTSASILALDEFGIPLDLARKIKRVLNVESLDETLDSFKSMDLSKLALSSFELELIQDAQQYA